MKSLKISSLIIIAGVFITVMLGGCKKFVQLPAPSTLLVTSNVFDNNLIATSAVTSIYTQMVNGSETYNLSLYTGLAGDELTNYSLSNLNLSFYRDNLSPQSESAFGNWINFYNYIYQANAILENIPKSSSLSPLVIKQLRGEAEFIRAFCHFYLVCQYGDIPVVTSTDYTINSHLSRSVQSKVYEQVIADLKDAQTLLNNNFIDASDTAITVNRVRPTSWAATALLARVYLYAKDYVNAKVAATAVINNSGMFNLEGLNSVFLANSSEAIFQFGTPLPAFNDWNTPDGYSYILTSAPQDGGANSSTISPQLMSAFETGDNRKTSWIGSFTADTSTYYFPYKYKVYQSGDITENVMVLRLAEQYLIRAEAEAQQNDLPDAVTDLNVIRNRAGLGGYSGSSDQASVLFAIMHERQVELFSEWGHRWFDLNRTGTIGTVMSVVAPQKASSWSADNHQALFPIPVSEILQNKNLMQNPGY